MPILSLILLLAFLIVIFPLRSLLRKARFGSASRANYGRGRPSAWWIADLLFLAGFALVLAGPVLAVGDGKRLIFDPGTGIIWIAIIVTVISTGLAIWSQETMGKAWRPDISPAGDAGLVTAGPFRFIRNPNYLAMLGAAGGATLLAPTFTGIAGGMVLLIGLALTARAEEPGLRGSYGSAYRDYAAVTGRFLPGIGLIPESAEAESPVIKTKGNIDE